MIVLTDFKVLDGFRAVTILQSFLFYIFVVILTFAFFFWEFFLKIDAQFFILTLLGLKNKESFF